MQRLWFIVPVLAACSAQKPDLTYDTSVAHPAYTSASPCVLIDEAHRNFHTADGRYAPFARLLANDGYTITRNESPFTTEALALCDVLVISNAKGEEEKYLSAFTEDECTAVEAWVREGGSLLLIADHYPMGSAAEPLARRFGVEMGKGYVSDSVHCEPDSKWKDDLVFSRENGLLKAHPITEGRNASEMIGRVVTFTGQSLHAPPGATVLLELASSAAEAVPDSIWKDGGKTYTRFTDPLPLQGRCQGLAMVYGEGRVVVMGEAAALTAQVSDGVKVGMNVPGNDNRQLVLNILHWLSRLM